MEVWGRWPFKMVLALQSAPALVLDEVNEGYQEHVFN